MECINPRQVLESGCPSVLILGVDSQIGSALYRKLNEEKRYQVYGTSRRVSNGPSEDAIFRLDLSENPSPQKIAMKFDAVVFCAGITEIEACEQEPERVRKINVEYTIELIKILNNANSYVLFLSSNAVFDGTKSFYTPQDLPNPINNYGLFKKEVEDECVKMANIGVLRLTKIITDSTPFIKKWKKEIEAGNRIKPSVNRLLSPIDMGTVISTISLILDRRATGLFHLGGDEEITYAQFYQKHFSKDPNALNLLSIGDEEENILGRIHNSLATHLPTIESQYTDLLNTRRHKMGLMAGHAYIQDPKRLTFTLSRYKFVAKMLAGKCNVLEVGCADAFGTPIVLNEVQKMTAVDIDWTFINDAKLNHPYRDRITFERLDFLQAPTKAIYDGIFCLDVLEHIKPEDELKFLSNLCSSLVHDGVLIVGIPSLESQQYASAISKAGHVNCKTGTDLKKVLSSFFSNVFLFSMNDEVVHTGFTPMAHYLLALCCQKRSAPICNGFAESP